MEINDKYLTVVFCINDNAVFETELKILLDKFRFPVEGEAWIVSAMSRANEIQRLALIEQALDKNSGYEAADLIQEIVGLIDPSKYDTIEQLESEAT